MITTTPGSKGISLDILRFLLQTKIFVKGKIFSQEILAQNKKSFLCFFETKQNYGSIKKFLFQTIYFEKNVIGQKEIFG